MDETRNPFAPGAGTQPPELAGRDGVLASARVTLARTKAGKAPKSQLLVGLRGVGKTVLLNRIREIAEDESYYVTQIEAHEGKQLASLLLPPLRATLLKLDRVKSASDLVKRALRVLKSFANVSIKGGDLEITIGLDPEQGAADSGDLEVDLPELFLAVANAAKAREAAVAILIDEMQYLTEKELSALIMAIHRCGQSGLPLTLFGAGLPQLLPMAGKSKSYAERLFDFPNIGSLGREAAREALQAPVRREGVKFQEAALDAIDHDTGGYPYFLQEWGYQVWNIAKASPITLKDAKQATAKATERLDQSFFRMRFERLTQREKDYLRAMAELGPGPHRSGDIADMLGLKVQSVAPLRAGLISKGMIFSPAHGETAFTVPLFDQFLKRAMPKFERVQKGGGNGT